MSRRFILAAVAAACALWPSATAADPITVVIQRNVRASLFVADLTPGEEVTQRDLDFLVASVSRTTFDRTVVTATATQASDISDPLHLSATGAGNAFWFNLADAAAVPEPASMLLVGSGLLGLVHAARRRHRTN